MAAGLAPLVPHFTCYYASDTPEINPHGMTHEQWLNVDFAWVEVSDALLRLPGESKGADAEVACATARGIPVHKTMADVMNWKARREREIEVAERAKVDAATQAAKPPVLKPGEFPPINHPSSQAFESLLEEMRQTHRKKAADYGTDKDPFANIRSSEELDVPASKGAWLRGKDKVKRNDQFFRTGKLANESIKDSLLDLANYCVITQVMLQEQAASN